MPKLLSFTNYLWKLSQKVVGKGLVFEGLLEHQEESIHLRLQAHLRTNDISSAAQEMDMPYFVSMNEKRFVKKVRERNLTSCNARPPLLTPFSSQLSMNYDSLLMPTPSDNPRAFFRTKEEVRSEEERSESNFSA